MAGLTRTLQAICGCHDLPNALIAKHKTFYWPCLWRVCEQLDMCMPHKDTAHRWKSCLQPRFRSMWERYCRGVQAIVYVVDAADHDNLDSARLELAELLSKPSLQGIPLLVLGNKNDLPGALSTTDLIDRLDLKVHLHLPAAWHKSRPLALLQAGGGKHK